MKRCSSHIADEEKGDSSKAVKLLKHCSRRFWMVVALPELHSSTAAVGSRQLKVVVAVPWLHGSRGAAHCRLGT